MNIELKKMENKYLGTELVCEMNRGQEEYENVESSVILSDHVNFSLLSIETLINELGVAHGADDHSAIWTRKKKRFCFETGIRRSCAG